MGIGNIYTDHILCLDTPHHTFTVEGLVYPFTGGRLGACGYWILVQQTATCKAFQPSRRDTVAYIQHHDHLHLCNHNQRHLDNHDTYLYGARACGLYKEQKIANKYKRRRIIFPSFLY